MIKALFAADADKFPKYQTALQNGFDHFGIDVDLSMDHAPQDVDYIVYAPNSAVQDFTPFSKCKAVLNLWAGVEAVVGNPTLNMPLARMVDPGMTDGMVEWVLGHVMRYHLDTDRNVLNQTGTWDPHVPPLAQQRHITVLGLGELGSAVATTLAQLKFSVTGWSRSPKSLKGITCEHGDSGLKTALKHAEILVLLLPFTAATENTLNADTLNALPKGVKIINPGRGQLIDDAALLAALDTGHVAHATLDVFRTEPLPRDNPYWAHPNVTVTPHIASETRAETAAMVIAENIHRFETGLPLLHLVDRAAGY